MATTKHYATYHPIGYAPPEGSWATSDAIRRSMLGCRGRNTKPELELRSRLHRSGLRFRVNRRPVAEIRRTADIVFTRRRVAVFLDGCFWHACPEHFVEPSTNASYWSAKIAGNSTRDAATNELLGAAGWKVVRIWEHVSLDEAEAIVRASLGLI
jgi:DNA mismatch endonuclease (patch repair protein)